MDTIEIASLRCQAHIGVTEQERQTPQPLAIDIRLHLDLQPAGRADALPHTVNYHELVDRVEHWVRASRFQLLEALAEHLCGEILNDSRIASVELRIRKYPEPLRGRVDYTAVQMLRKRA